MRLTTEQRHAISATIRRYSDADTPCDGLAGHTVRDGGEYWADWASDDPGQPNPWPAGTVVASFQYVRQAGAGTGLEVTVFAPDGSVLTSQDFG